MSSRILRNRTRCYQACSNLFVPRGITIDEVISIRIVTVLEWRIISYDIHDQKDVWFLVNFRIDDNNHNIVTKLNKYWYNIDTSIGGFKILSLTKPKYKLSYTDRDLIVSKVDELINL